MSFKSMQLSKSEVCLLPFFSSCGWFPGKPGAVDYARWCRGRTGGEGFEFKRKPMPNRVVVRLVLLSSLSKISRKEGQTSIEIKGFSMKISCGKYTKKILG